MTIEMHIATTANVPLRLVRQYIARGFVRVDEMVITPEHGKWLYTGQAIVVNNKGGNCLAEISYAS